MTPKVKETELMGAKNSFVLTCIFESLCYALLLVSVLLMHMYWGERDKGLRHIFD
jgi:hypothetical protein